MRESKGAFMPSDLRPDTNVNIQILYGQPVTEIGHVAMMIFNCPVVAYHTGREDEHASDVIMVPGVQLTARQAMEIGMNLIHIAKVAETHANAQA